ncbi:MAG TPA: ATP-binding protein [Candidatus Saccharimonadales bacterium]|nr:ATP-binding protein [Candidatus Saccharimonadales bacterium]
MSEISSQRYPNIPREVHVEWAGATMEISGLDNIRESNRAPDVVHTDTDFDLDSPIQEAKITAGIVDVPDAGPGYGWSAFINLRCNPAMEHSLRGEDIAEPLLNNPPRDGGTDFQVLPPPDATARGDEHNNIEPLRRYDIDGNPFDVFVRNRLDNQYHNHQLVVTNYSASNENPALVADDPNLAKPGGAFVDESQVASAFMKAYLHTLNAASTVETEFLGIYTEKRLVGSRDLSIDIPEHAPSNGDQPWQVTESKALIAKDGQGRNDGVSLKAFVEVVHPKETFGDIYGYEEVKQVGRTKVEELDPGLRAQYRERGISIEPALYLVGPPGNGKTMIAKAIANTARAEVWTLNASDVLDEYIGNSEHKLDAIFKEVMKRDPAKSRPLVVIMDECDSLIGKLGDTTHGGHAANNLTNIFKRRFSDVAEKGTNVLFCMSTNDDSLVDDAATRSGRSDRIEVPNPDFDTRIEVMEGNMGKLAAKYQNSQLFGPDVTPEAIAEMSAAMDGCCCADIGKMFNDLDKDRVRQEFYNNRRPRPTPLEPVSLDQLRRHAAPFMKKDSD